MRRLAGYLVLSELEAKITKAIATSALEDLERYSESDVVIVGAGPSGLTAAYYLAKRGFKVLVVERRLSFGGGIGGGGMLLPRVVIDERGLKIVEEIGLKVYRSKVEGLYTAYPEELIARLAVKAVEAGARIWLGVSVEDVIYRCKPNRIAGVVVQWSAVQLAGLHVDPLFLVSKAVVDATGHEAEVLRIVEKKLPEFGVKIAGEKSAFSAEADKLVVEYTGKVVDGLYVAGMAVAALYGLPRMGPLFTGMLLSGKKVAEVIARDLST